MARAAGARAAKPRPAAGRGSAARKAAPRSASARARPARRSPTRGRRASAHPRPASPARARQATRGRAAATPLAVRVLRAPAARALRARAGGVLDALLHGQGWIAVVGVLLAGIVFINVYLLQLNRDIAATSERAAAVKRENARLRLDVARLGSSERIQLAAAEQGLVLPAPGEVRYLRANPRIDGRRAAKRVEAPGLALAPEPLAPEPVAPDPAAPDPAAPPLTTAPATGTPVAEAPVAEEQTTAVPTEPAAAPTDTTAPPAG
jgi:cell division protein FtsL